MPGDGDCVLLDKEDHGARVNWQPNSTDPEIFHITHVTNLQGIIAGGLLSDAALAKQKVAATNIGYPQVKARRLTKPVQSYPGTTVGDFVPFYFCPRSVMLYVANRGATGHPPGCQVDIVHLVSRVSTASAAPSQWAFTTTNAAAAFTTQFHTVLTNLTQVQWWAMSKDDWRMCKDERQAEFLVRNSFPWTAVHEIWVHGQSAAQKVQVALTGAQHRPPVHVRPDCYYP